MEKVNRILLILWSDSC